MLDVEYTTRGSTCHLSVLDATTTLAVGLGVPNVTGVGRLGDTFLCQIQTRVYPPRGGTPWLRVQTVARSWVAGLGGASLVAMLQGFDAEAAAVLLALCVAWRALSGLEVGIQEEGVVGGGRVVGGE